MDPYRVHSRRSRPDVRPSAVVQAEHRIHSGRRFGKTRNSITLFGILNTLFGMQMMYFLNIFFFFICYLFVFIN